MSYQIIPNIIFILCILGVAILILRRVPEIAELEDQRKRAIAHPEPTLPSKGVTLIDPSKIKTAISFWLKRLWHFSLEAKDIRHSAVVSYRIKKMFRKGSNGPTPIHPTPSAEPLVATESGEMTEEQLLEAIRKYPKDLAHYGDLGQYYIDNKNFIDAEHVYDYLVKHDPSNHTYHAKLAFAFLNLKNYEAAVTEYQKSLDFDPGHPNRYYNLGLAYKGLHKIDEAVAAFQRAHELEPKNSKYRAAAKGSSS